MYKALRKYWWLALAAIAGVVGLVLGYRRGPLWRMADELDVIAAGERAEREAAERGHQVAVDKQNRLYANKIAELTDAQAKKADRLLRDPGARARYLARISSRRAGDPI